MAYDRRLLKKFGRETRGGRAPPEHSVRRSHKTTRCAVTLLFQNVGRIKYGHNCISEIGEEVKLLGCSRVLLVTDKGLIEHDVHMPLLHALREAGLACTVFSDVELDPSPVSIEQGVLLLKEFKADLIVGIGGGSALDSAKALALRGAHKGPLERYFGLELVPSACLPIILVPTTAGTGSEMTSIVVLGNKETGSKKGIVSRYLFAKTVFLDPDLTLQLPPYYTAITGMDAFIHAMESYVNISATPFTEAVCLQAMRMIAENIRKAFANGNNKEARARMLYASALSGMGFANTQTGLIHALGHAVPSTYHLPHGRLMAAVCPMGMAFNCIAAPEKYANVADILGCNASGKNINERAASAVAGMENLLKDLGLAPGLAPLGVDRADIPGIAGRAAADTRLMAKNPRQGTAKELEALLQQHF